jgi:hypothetical protein
MADPNIEAHLRHLPIFAALNPDEISRVAGAVRPLRFEAGQAIFRQGDAAQGMYKFASGTGMLVQTAPDGTQRQLGRISANQYLNDAALTRPLQEAATLIVTEPAIVLLIPREGLIDALRDHPETAARLGITLPPRSRPALSPLPVDPDGRPRPPLDRRPPAPPFSQAETPSAPTTPAIQASAAPPPELASSPAAGRQTPAGRAIAGAASLSAEPIAPSTAAQAAQPGSGLRFASQRPDEQVLLETRRHWWAYVRRAWFSAFVLILGVVISGFVPSPILSLLALMVALLLPGGLMLYYYLEWRNDYVIITDQRVVRIERTIYNWRTHISEVPLTSIQEVNADFISGDIFSRILGFGMVELRTPGTAGNIRLTLMPDPEAIQDLIFANRERQQQQVQRQHRDEIRGAIDQAIAARTGGSAPASNLASPAASPSTERQGGWRPFGQTRFINEQGALVFRKHFFYWARMVALPTALLIGGLIYLLVLMLLPDTIETGAAGVLIGLVVILIGGLWFYLADWDWRHDMYMITDDKIEIIHRRPLWLQNENDQILLSRVDNVTSDKHGIFQSLFNYGNVTISLIGSQEGEAKRFRFVPTPQVIQAEITRRIDSMGRKRQQQDEQRRRDEMAEYLAVYHEQQAAQQAAQSAQNPAASPGVIPAANFPNASPGAPEPRTPPVPGRDNVRPPNIPRPRS